MNPWLFLLLGGGAAYLWNQLFQNQLNTQQQTAFQFSTPNWLTQAVNSMGTQTMPSKMDVSSNGLAFIRQQEGLRLNPYKDSAGNWTIGYGHKIVAGDPYYPVGQVTSISAAQAEQLFEQDVENIAAQYIRGYVLVPLTQNQFDALCSLVYNIGPANFEASTLLRDLNSSDYAGAANEFNKWIYSGGIQDPVLIQRRAAESQMFQT